MFAHLKISLFPDWQNCRMTFVTTGFLCLNIMLCNSIIQENALAQSQFGRDSNGQPGLSSGGGSLNLVGNSGGSASNSKNFQGYTKLKDVSGKAGGDYTIVKKGKNITVPDSSIGKSIQWEDDFVVILAGGVKKLDVATGDDVLIHSDEESGQNKTSPTKAPGVSPVALRPRKSVDFYAMSLEELSNIEVSAGP